MNTHKVLSLTLAVALLTAAQASALDTFRGIVKDQASIGQPDNTHISPSMDRVDHKWHIDLEDNFNAYPTRSFGDYTAARSVGDPLAGSFVDTHRIGFVPPTENDPQTGQVWNQGALPGHSDHGHWGATGFGATDYVLSADHGGSVHRATGTGVGIVCNDWRVSEGLGDDYLYEVTAVVGAGADNHLTMGYMHDEDVYALDGNGNPNNLLDSRFGSLVLDVHRGGENDENIFWEVQWDINGARPGTGTNLLADASGNAVQVGLEEELRLILGWNDVPDTWDAWLEVAGQMFQLDGGDLGAPISVFGVAFQTGGTGTYVTGHLAAVPEPASGLLMLAGLAGLTGMRRWRRR